jgi:hypothetical protein
LTPFKVTVVDCDDNEQVFEDASFTVSENGFLQVSVNGKAVFCWAPGFWARVSMVSQDG